MDLLHRYIETKGISKSLMEKDHLMTAACCVFLATKMISVHIHHVASKIIEFYYDFRKSLLPSAKQTRLQPFTHCQTTIESEFYAIEFDILKQTNFANPPDTLPVNLVLRYKETIRAHIKLQILINNLAKQH